MLLCVQTGSNLADPSRFKFDGDGYYLKSAAEMRAAFTDEQWQSGCDNDADDRRAGGRWRSRHGT